MSPEAAVVRAWLGDALPEPVFERLDAYAGEVLRCGRRVNLTAAKDLGEIWRRHLADGLAALAPLKARLAGVSAPRLVDLGCGAGFVGIALKAAWPELEVWLVESSYRKASFLTLATVRLGLPGIRAYHGRADGTGLLKLKRQDGGEAGTAEPAADAVLARALAPRDEALALARPLAKLGGWAGLFQSEKPEGFESDAYRLPAETSDRYLMFARRTA
ncbi:MAG: class I SAM-dependent methyltransferase [Elusimicrobia bacterium]|nr:class I SAM-dependent methyltransferase [Elusimicrobiota bacterium]